MNTKFENIRKLTAIMFTDIVGYTAMMQRDEQYAKTIRDKHRDVLESKIKKQRGKILQFYGDGTLSVFDSAIEAVICAKEIQIELMEQPKIPLRIGIHLGDIVHDKDGIYGDGVNVASRIQSLCTTGSVMISEKVQAEITNHPTIKSFALGSYELKNVQKPVKVFALAGDRIKVPTVQEIQQQSKKSVIKKSIAILPFINMSNDSENDYFADGIAEEIMNGLNRLEGITVISRTSSFAFRGKNKSINEIGSDLKVPFILEGSVRKDADDVRVMIQLINTADEYQLWSEVYERKINNVFDVQDEIARNVVHRLKENLDIKSSKTKIIERPTKNIDAYNLFLKGRYHWTKWNPDDIQKAIKVFDEAIRLDPKFSLPYCALSHCYSFLGSCGQLTPSIAYTKANEFALESIQRNENHAESHLALAMIKFFHLWDWEGTRVSLEKAINLNLNSSLLNQIYGLYLATVGKTKEAIERLENAVKLDPLSLSLICELGTVCFFDAQYDRAISYFDAALDMDPSFRMALELKGVALFMIGETEASLENLLEYQKLTKHPLKGMSILGLVYELLGDSENANACLNKLMQRQEQEPNVSLELDFAILYYGLRDYDKVFHYLNVAYEKHLGIICLGMVFFIRGPIFSDIWNDPRFEELINKIGLSKN